MARGRDQSARGPTAGARARIATARKGARRTARPDRRTASDAIRDALAGRTVGGRLAGARGILEPSRRTSGARKSLARKGVATSRRNVKSRTKSGNRNPLSRARKG
jgi:hypothetical protein